jgi:DNA-binding transcriptional MerR regulator
MAEAPRVVIPDKPAFKAAEVCELAGIQPYVLRSWESEFPDLGVSRTPGGPRVYRRADVERVLRIHDLVFAEGLTLSGVRRRFEAESSPPEDDAADLLPFAAEAPAHDVYNDATRAQILKLKQDLRSLLDLLDDRSSDAFRLAPRQASAGRKAGRK